MISLGYVRFGHSPSSCIFPEVDYHNFADSKDQTAAPAYQLSTLSDNNSRLSY